MSKEKDIKKNDPWDASIDYNDLIARLLEKEAVEKEALDEELEAAEVMGELLKNE